MEVDSHKKMELEKMKAGKSPEAVKFIDLLTEWVDNDYAKEGMLPFRFEHLEENQEIMPFIEKRYDKYQKWKLQFWSSNKQELTEEKFDDVYHIEVFYAL